MQAPGRVLTVERLGQRVSHLFYLSRRLYGRKLPPFQPVIPTLCRPPASLVAEIRSGHRLAYPAGKGNAVILPRMAPNSRRVRWLSSSRSQ
jgi:hypothetical protein